MSHKQSVEKRTHALKTCNFGHVLPFPTTKESLIARLMKPKYCHPTKMIRISSNG
jgi:hypothetical protein